jgi:nucleoside-diphosphate-sugar epimerase
MVKQRVLITGASGLIGQLLLRGLEDEYDVSCIDARRSPSRSIRRANMTRLRVVERSFEGADLVIDLAAQAAADTPWRDVYRNNVPATFNALEASRRAGVRRVLYASSNHVTGLYELDDPYAAIVAGRYGGLDASKIPYVTARHPVRPDGPYALGKVFGEAAGRYYAEQFGISVICLRIGTVNESGVPRKPRDFATLLTHGDLVRLVESCLRAPDDLRYGIFYGVSANTWRFWDIEDAEAAVGYVPEDNAENWRSAGT